MQLKDKIQANRKSKLPYFIGLVGVTALAVTAYMNNIQSNTQSSTQNSTASVDSRDTTPSISNIVSNTIQRVQSTVSEETSYSNTIYETDYTRRFNALEDIKNVGNFDIDTKMSDSQIAKTVSQIQFKKGNMFLALASMAEGYRKGVYADNRGVAVGFGHNLSYQSKTTNKNIYSMFTKDQSVIDAAMSITGVMDGSALPAAITKKVDVTPQQAAQSTQVLGYLFRADMPKVIGEQAKVGSVKARQYMRDNSITPTEFGEKVLTELANNEQGAMLEHTYKVGAGGLAKYKGLINSLVEYHFDKTPQLAEKTASHFTYKYTINGQVKEDVRASALIINMFLNKNGFAHIIDKTVTYPDGLKARINSISPKLIKEENGQIVPAADPVGEQIEILMKQNTPIKIEQSFKTQDLQPLGQSTAPAKTTTKAYGGMRFGGGF